MTQRLFPDNLNHNNQLLLQLGSSLPLAWQQLEFALQAYGIVPDRSNWLRWLLVLIPACGLVMLLAGVVFFFAWNWESMHRFSRFTVIGMGIIAAVALALRFGLEQWTGKLALTAAAILTGVLLATFGMVYQTGADSYQLFLSWVLLILPWVLISRFQVLWLLALIIANIAILSWADSLPSAAPDRAIGLLFLLNGGILLLRDRTRLIRYETGGHRWFIDLSALLLIMTVSYTPFHWIIDPDIANNSLSGWLLLALYPLTLFVLAYYALRIRHNLLILSMICASLIIISTAWLIQLVSFRDAGSFLIIGLYVIATVSAATSWLMKIKRSWNPGDEHDG